MNEETKTIPETISEVRTTPSTIPVSNNGDMTLTGILESKEDMKPKVTEISTPVDPIQSTKLTTTEALLGLSHKRTFDKALKEAKDLTPSLIISQTGDIKASPEPQTKLARFQAIPLEDTIDYQAISSALSLLESRLYRIKSDIKDLKDLKKTLRGAKDLKELSSSIHSNQSYLKEISYKGVVVKCPIINWKRDYDIDIDKLKDPEMLLRYNEEKDRVGQKYEVIRRSSVFN